MPNSSSESKPFRQHLPDELLQRVYSSAIRANLATAENLEALRSGMLPGYAAMLRTQGAPATVLLSNLGELNTREETADSQAPFAIWLTNATLLSDALVEQAVFREALEQIEAAQPTDPLAGYRRLVAQRCRNLPALGESSAEWELLLEKVYVPLQLGENDPQRAPQLGTTEPHRSATGKVLDILREHRDQRRWVILGDPGSGKTTLLRHLAWDLALRQAGTPWVPALIPLPRWDGDFIEALEKILRAASQPTRGFRDALHRKAEGGKLLLLFDGLDEVAKEARSDVLDQLQLMLDSEPWCRATAVVASRPVSFDKIPDFLELRVQPLDHEQQGEFLARRLGWDAKDPRLGLHQQHLASHPDLQRLAGIPLYLTFIAQLLREGREPLPNRADLYLQILELLYEGGHRPQEQRRPLRLPEAAEHALQHLAAAMTEDGLDQEPLKALISRLATAKAVKQELAEEPAWAGGTGLRTFLQEVAEQTSILAPHNGSRQPWTYWHRTFREALAAQHLREQWEVGAREQILSKTKGLELPSEYEKRHEGLADSPWAEPYTLLAGLAQPADELVEALYTENPKLGERALGTTQALSQDTLRRIVEQLRWRDQENWLARAQIYRRLPDLLERPQQVLELIESLRRGTRDGNDLYFLDAAVQRAGQLWPEAKEEIKALRGNLLDHIAHPAEQLFLWIEIPDKGQADLWCKVEAGTYWIGSSGDEGHDDEMPRHQVTLEQPFWIASVPVTNAQYAAFDPGLPVQPWEGVSDDELPLHPRVNVTWFAASMFCRWLAGYLRGARLPLEEEWEIACRAGSRRRYWSGESEKDLGRVGWYGEGHEGRTRRVGELEPNELGLYDLHGNVWNRALNQYDSARYAGRDHTGFSIDPTAIRAETETDPASGAPRVLRGGGGWFDANRGCAIRGKIHPVGGWVDRGFRVMLPFAPEQP